MRFDRCLVNNALCGPSRASIITGTYSHINGFYNNSNCRFDACEWKFDDEAGRTLAYLKVVWGLGEKSLVQGLIKDITGGGGR